MLARCDRSHFHGRRSLWGAKRTWPEPLPARPGQLVTHNGLWNGLDRGVRLDNQGGLIGYGPSLPLIWRQSARLVVKVFRGVRPEDIPVEQPTNFSLVVNLATAKALDLTIPE